VRRVLLRLLNHHQRKSLDLVRRSLSFTFCAIDFKQCKRGRKGMGMTPLLDHMPNAAELLASASQSLVHELSCQTRSASASVQSLPNVPPPPLVPAPVSTPTVTKKPSRWKLSFGKNAGSHREARRWTGFRIWHGQYNIKNLSVYTLYFQDASAISLTTS
jgi:hypothetical protein